MVTLAAWEKKRPGGAYKRHYGLLWLKGSSLVVRFPAKGFHLDSCHVPENSLGEV